MPKYAKRKRQNKKRTYRKNVKKGSKIDSSRLIGKRISILPDRMFTKMKYRDNNQNYITVANTNFYGTRTFTGNGIYDPDLNIGNYGCLGMSEWAAFYNKYRVHSSRIKVIFTQADINGDPLDSARRYRCTIVPTDLSYTGSTANWPKGQVMAPYAKTKDLGNAGGGHDQCTITNYMSVCKMEGSNCPKYDISYAATTTSNPVNQFYWQVIVGAVDGVLSAPYSLGCQVEIEYFVEFYSRKDLADTLQGPVGGRPITEQYGGGWTGVTGPSVEF